jgi:hypothetical protein
VVPNAITESVSQPSIQLNEFVLNACHSESGNVDFLNFNKGLRDLYDKLDGYANFNCLEDYLEIKVKGDGLGNFSADCIANDKQTIPGNKLEFSLEFDQTEISSLSNMLDEILDKFPIKEIDEIKRNNNL